MQQMKGKVLALLVSVFAVAALTFGASQLGAESAATTCPYDPPHQLGYAADEGTCHRMCDDAGGATGLYNSGTGCCGCALR
jgi:hypothetical protein